MSLGCGAARARLCEPGLRDLGLAWPRLCGPGRQAHWPRVHRGLGGLIFSGFISSSSSFFFFFSLLALISFLAGAAIFFIYGLINLVFKTRFSSGRHMENDATSNVIRPRKSSLKDSIYGSKSSLLYSSC